jgi:hypothetical protein
VATDHVPEMSAYGDDVFKDIVTDVCTLLKGKDTTAADNAPSAKNQQPRPRPQVPTRLHM